MFERYHAHVRGQPERKFWKAGLVSDFIVATDEEMAALMERDCLVRGEWPSDRPTTSLTRKQANEVSRRFSDAVVEVFDNEVFWHLKRLFRR